MMENTNLWGAARGWALELKHRLEQRVALRRIEDAFPVLIYQMGKVGSSTVAATLEQLDLDRPVLHVHTLAIDHVEQAIRKQRNSVSPYLPHHLVTSRLLAEKLVNERFPCQIITLTREPVGRAISFVFEDWKKKAREARSANGVFDIEAVNQAVTNLLRNHNGHADPGHWFERELHRVWGIDAFAVPYDHKCGFTIIRKEGVEVLLIRMEDLNRALIPALEALLDKRLGRAELKRANTGAKKWYAEDLRAVKNAYCLPEDIADTVFQTQYMTHFYEPRSDQLRDRWLCSDRGGDK